MMKRGVFLFLIITLSGVHAASKEYICKHTQISVNPFDSTAEGVVDIGSEDPGLISLAITSPTSKLRSFKYKLGENFESVNADGDGSGAFYHDYNRYIISTKSGNSHSIGYSVNELFEVSTVATENVVYIHRYSDQSLVYVLVGNTLKRLKIEPTDPTEYPAFSESLVEMVSGNDKYLIYFKTGSAEVKSIDLSQGALDISTHDISADFNAVHKIHVAKNGYFVVAGTNSATTAKRICVFSFTATKLDIVGEGFNVQDGCFETPDTADVHAVMSKEGNFLAIGVSGDQNSLARLHIFKLEDNTFKIFKTVFFKSSNAPRFGFTEQTDDKLYGGVFLYGDALYSMTCRYYDLDPSNHICEKQYIFPGLTEPSSGYYQSSGEPYIRSDGKDTVLNIADYSNPNDVVRSSIRHGEDGQPDAPTDTITAFAEERGAGVYFSISMNQDKTQIIITEHSGTGVATQITFSNTITKLPRFFYYSRFQGATLVERLVFLDVVDGETGTIRVLIINEDTNGLSLVDDQSFNDEFSTISVKLLSVSRNIMVYNSIGASFKANYLVIRSCSLNANIICESITNGAFQNIYNGITYYQYLYDPTVFPFDDLQPEDLLGISASSRTVNSILSTTFVLTHLKYGSHRSCASLFQNSNGVVLNINFGSFQNAVENLVIDPYTQCIQTTCPYHHCGLLHYARLSPDGSYFTVVTNTQVLLFTLDENKLGYTLSNPSNIVTGARSIDSVPFTALTSSSSTDVVTGSFYSKKFGLYNFKCVPPVCKKTSIALTVDQASYNRPAQVYISSAKKGNTEGSVVFYGISFDGDPDSPFEDPNSFTRKMCFFGDNGLPMACFDTFAGQGLYLHSETNSEGNDPQTLMMIKEGDRNKTTANFEMAPGELPFGTTKRIFYYKGPIDGCDNSVGAVYYFTSSGELLRSCHRNTNVLRTVESLVTDDVVVTSVSFNGNIMVYATKKYSVHVCTMNNMQCNQVDYKASSRSTAYSPEDVTVSASGTGKFTVVTKIGNAFYGCVFRKEETGSSLIPVVRNVFQLTNTGINLDDTIQNNAYSGCITYTKIEDDDDDYLNMVISHDGNYLATSTKRGYMYYKARGDNNNNNDYVPVHSQDVDLLYPASIDLLGKFGEKVVGVLYEREVGVSTFSCADFQTTGNGVYEITSSPYILASSIYTTGPSGEKYICRNGRSITRTLDYGRYVNISVNEQYVSLHGQTRSNFLHEGSPAVIYNFQNQDSPLVELPSGVGQGLYFGLDENNNIGGYYTNSASDKIVTFTNTADADSYSIGPGNGQILYISPAHGCVYYLEASDSDDANIKRFCFDNYGPTKIDTTFVSWHSYSLLIRGKYVAIKEENSFKLCTTKITCLPSVDLRVYTTNPSTTHPGTPLSAAKPLHDFSVSENGFLVTAVNYEDFGIQIKAHVCIGHYGDNMVKLSEPKFSIESTVYTLEVNDRCVRLPDLDTVKVSISPQGNVIFVLGTADQGSTIHRLLFQRGDNNVFNFQTVEWELLDGASGVKDISFFEEADNVFFALASSLQVTKVDCRKTSQGKVDIYLMVLFILYFQVHFNTVTTTTLF